MRKMRVEGGGGVGGDGVGGDGVGDFAFAGFLVRLGLEAVFLEPLEAWRLGCWVFLFDLG